MVYLYYKDMLNQPLGLISVLLDKTAREDERHDAAIDLAKYPTKETLMALIETASDDTEDTVILDACGESIAEIWINLGEIQPEKINNLSKVSWVRAKALIKHYKPEWEIYFKNN